MARPGVAVRRVVVHNVRLDVLRCSAVEMHVVRAGTDHVVAVATAPLEPGPYPAVLTVVRDVDDRIEGGFGAAAGCIASPRNNVLGFYI